VIISIGVDIIEVGRVRETIERTPRFAERVFTDAERAYCESRGAASAQHYAARFAAKEAALKALQTGWSGGISWQDVERFGRARDFISRPRARVVRTKRRCQSASFDRAYNRTCDRGSDSGEGLSSFSGPVAPLKPSAAANRIRAREKRIGAAFCADRRGWPMT